MTLSAKARAERAAAAMLARDAASGAVGLELGRVDAGQAEMRLRVAGRHLNGHGLCHGGVIFMLADTCFAVAANSDNRNTLAQHGMISYLAPARAGDLLTATARSLSRVGRNGIVDVCVRNQNGETIAEFRGFSRSIRGRLFDEEAPGHAEHAEQADQAERKR